MKKILKIGALNAAMLIGAAVSVLTSSFTGFAENCENIPDEVFRLHIIANSDSEYDQRFKYELRDYLLTEFSPKFSGSLNAAGARERAESLLPEIAEKANAFAESRNYQREITAEVTRMYFATRVYENATLPAGDYDALRVIIGGGEGKNWWCVMFPPLCLPACAKSEPEPYYTEAVSRKIENGGKVKIKFAVFEAFERWFK